VTHWTETSAKRKSGVGFAVMTILTRGMALLAFHRTMPIDISAIAKTRVWTLAKISKILPIAPRTNVVGALMVQETLIATGVEAPLALSIVKTLQITKQPTRLVPCQLRLAKGILCVCHANFRT